MSLSRLIRIGFACFAFNLLGHSSIAKADTTADTPSDHAPPRN